MKLLNNLRMENHGIIGLIQSPATQGIIVKSKNVKKRTEIIKQPHNAKLRS